MSVSMQETMAVIRKFAPQFTPKIGIILGSVAEELTHEGTLQHGEVAARKLVKLIPAFVKEVGRTV